MYRRFYKIVLEEEKRFLGNEGGNEENSSTRKLY